jgi:hypothetical protein
LTRKRLIGRYALIAQHHELRLMIRPRLPNHSQPTPEERAQA